MTCSVYSAGSGQPVVARLIEAGKPTLDDIKAAEKILRALEKDKP